MSTKPKYRISAEQYVVHINDPTIRDICNMLDFIKDSGLSFISVEDIDVSDVSVMWDWMRTYYFVKEEDALIFALKFKDVK